jgi:predicted acetyltransferase
MAIPDWKTLPLDETAVAAASDRGLDYRLLDTADPAAFDDFLVAIGRGFLEGEGTDARRAVARETIAFRRFTGAFDPQSPTPRVPVSTVDSWITDLTLPGGSALPMWAISGVTVAATHRRRGLARTMLEGELRTAASAGVAVAGLTVSEATIYGRYGFAPATFAADWRLVTARTRFTGPRPAGRLDYLDRGALAAELPVLHERVRLSRPGEIQPWPGLWRRLAGVLPEQENVATLRAVRWRDPAGTTRGLVVYRLVEDEKDYAHHTLEVVHLLTDGPDADAALWRFLLEHDLVSVVNAPLRAVDEPLRWMIADQRGATETRGEHGWLRVLDVPAALGARTYGAPGSRVLRVRDDLGFADGTFLLDVAADGSARVTATATEPHAEVGAGALASILLGGVRPSTLRGAGLIAASEAVAADLDVAFASPRTPYLSVWY